MRMEMSPRLQQTMKLAPRMIQSMEILQLPITALEERIAQEMEKNPVLELKETAPPDQDDPGEPATDDKFNPDAPLEHDRDAELDFKRLEEIDKDWDGHFNEEHRASRGAIDDAGDKKLDAMQNMPSRSQSLQDYLTEQLPYLELTPEQHEIVEYLIANLDANGWLKTPVEQLVQGFGKSVCVDQIEDCIDFLHKLDPPGIGARDLEECLLLQLTPETPHRDLIRMMLVNHLLEDVATNRLPVIQKRTGADLQTIADAIEVLKHLDPKPGSRFDTENVHYIVPDIIVEKNDAGEYTLRLTDDWIPEVRVSRRYLHEYKNRASDPKTRDYLRKNIQSAQWLIDAIQQRRNTLEKVTKAIISHQKAFLDKEQDYIEPLKMQQIADQVGVHVTTVSRAVDDKWAQTPRGVFPLKRFFGGGTTNQVTGEDVAWEKIKKQLLELIAHEDKSNPLSDEDLVKKLQETGYPVARRTVTKYRKMLKIPSSRQRKDWAAT
jgi:RNA polymerase sigma-54 factor